MNTMELLQLGQQVFTIDASATPDLPPADELVDHPHGAVGDAATPIAWIHFLLSPQGRQAAIVRMAFDQVFGHQHGRSPELAIALTDEGAICMIDLVALVSRRVQPGSP